MLMDNIKSWPLWNYSETTNLFSGRLSERCICQLIISLVLIVSVLMLHTACVQATECPSFHMISSFVASQRLSHSHTLSFTAHARCPYTLTGSEYNKGWGIPGICLAPAAAPSLTHAGVSEEQPIITGLCTILPELISVFELTNSGFCVWRVLMLHKAKSHFVRLSRAWEEISVDFI